MQVQPEHRSILAVDIEGFGRLDRTDPIRLGLHRQLRALLERALTSVGIPLQACELHDTGDGFIVSISSQVPKTRLLDPLPASLARRLARYNRTAPAARRLRLRLVVHAGEVLRDPQANVGDAVIFACRLLDAQQLRACLAATDAPLVVGVSEWIYTEVVRHGYGRIDPAGYQPVGFASKDTAGRAWVHVPGDPDAVGRAGLTRGEGLPSARGGGAMGLTGGRGETEPPVEGAMLAAAVFQLPAGIGDFTGRAHAVRGVVRRLAADHVRRPSAVAVCAIVGKGGVGKTTLAVQVAHKIAARFPDGQLYVNLRGVEAERLDPAEVLADLLRALGVAGSAIPDGLGERARRYRSRLAGRRVLVVLDNAADEAQVRPLLPGDPGCAVLVTSRARLAALEGAHTVDLDVLDPDQAVRLLGKIAGLQRVTAEPDHARAIVRRCGFLPLAIRIAGARLAARPHWPLAHLADQLADTRRRLDVLTIGDLDVRASVTVSYTAQDQEARRLFCRLGLLTSPDFPAWTAAALLGAPMADARAEAQAEELLERLVDAQLLEAAGFDVAGQLRYRFHDLLRDLARERLHTEEPAHAQQHVLRQVLEGYSQAARQADTHLEVGSLPHVGQDPAIACDPIGQPLTSMVTSTVDQATRRGPVAWLTAERPSLVAAITQAHAAGWWDLTWRLTNALVTFFDIQSLWDDWEQTHALALAAARQQGDERRELAMRWNLGRLYRDQGRWAAATACFEQCSAAFSRLGERRWEAATLRYLADVYRYQGRLSEALARLQQCLPMLHDLGDRQWETTALRSVALVYRDQGRWTKASAHLEPCLKVFLEVGDRRSAAYTRRILGDVLIHQGRRHEAVQHLRQTIADYQAMGDARRRAGALRSLGRVYAASHRWTQALRCLDEALAAYRQLHDRRREATALCLMAVVHKGRGQLDLARACCEHALVAFHDLGSDPWEAVALAGLADIDLLQRRLPEAATHARDALAIFRRLDNRYEEAKATVVLADTLAAHGEVETARRHWRQALVTLRDLDAPEAEPVARRLADEPRVPPSGR